MNATMNLNGKVRKSLASQIDRLDSMLDGLSDNLNEAVVSAVKQAVEVAVQEAVRGVLVEISGNPDLLTKLRRTLDLPSAGISMAQNGGDASPKRAVRTGVVKLCSWIGRCGRAVAQACRRRLQQVRGACGRVVRNVSELAASTWRRLQVVRRFKLQILVAVLVGAAVASGAYFAGAWLAATASGLGGFTTTLAVQAGLMLRRLWQPVLWPQCGSDA